MQVRNQVSHAPVFWSIPVVIFCMVKCWGTCGNFQYIYIIVWRTAYVSLKLWGMGMVINLSYLVQGC